MDQTLAVQNLFLKSIVVLKVSYDMDSLFLGTFCQQQQLMCPYKERAKLSA